MKGFLFTILASILIFSTVQAGFPFPGSPGPRPTFSGFVQVRPDMALYAEYVKPEAGKPTVILLNGLTYTVRQFDAYAQALANRGIGILRFDFEGMGQTLLKHVPSTHIYQYDQQVRDLKALLIATHIAPPYNLVGLSYGGGIAAAYAHAYPREIKNLILVAPYTEQLSGQDVMIRNEIRMTRMTFPMNPASDEQLYDFFLHQLVYATYPATEPIVLENPFKLEAVYNLVRGIRHYRPIDEAGQLPPGSVHMLQAYSDQYIPQDVYQNFWNHVNPAARMSRIRIYGTEHKMPEAIPEFTAKWTWQILQGNPLLRGGNEFEGWGLTGTVKLNGRDVPMPE